MSRLASLRACATVGDLALLLGFSPAGLGYIVRKYPDSAKYIAFEIPKRSGGRRIIHAPIPRLKLVQRRLAGLLEECVLEIEASLGVKRYLAHGFRKDHSIFTNADVHCGKRFVLNFDLHNFFGTINFGRVYGYFRRNRYFRLHDDVALLIAQIVCHESKLPQGSPCSPIISNLIGGILDARLVKLARANGCSYSRYADDITISTSVPIFPGAIAVPLAGGGWELSNSVISAVAVSGFSVNTAKTRMLLRPSRQDVTGVVVNRHVNVNADYRRKVRAMVDRLRSTGSFDIERPELDGAGSTRVAVRPGTRAQLQGMLAFCLQAERYRQRTDGAPIELTGGERLLRRFHFYTSFANGEVPLVVCEGKTDGIYLSAAIRSLVGSFPAFGVSTTGNIATRILRLTPQVERLFGLSGGEVALKHFIHGYADEYRFIKGPKGDRPVIAVFDNDEGSKGILSMLKNFYKTPIAVGDQYIRVCGNLYVVLTSPHNPGAPPHCIEKCFDAATLNTPLSGKTLSLSNKALGPNEYGKAWFAEKVVKPNAKSIDFSGFAQLLSVLSHIISTHKP